MDSLLIVYATETGTAQDTAESLSHDAKYRNIRARVLSLEDYNIEVTLILPYFQSFFYALAYFYETFVRVRFNVHGRVPAYTHVGACVRAISYEFFQFTAFNLYSYLQIQLPRQACML